MAKIKSFIIRKYIGVFITGMILMSSSFCCLQQDNLDVFSLEERNELRSITSTVDSIILDKTSADNINQAYKIFFTNFEELSINTSLSKDIHNFLIEIQNYLVFKEIWRYRWVMNIDTYKRELWLSINESGKIWQGIYDKKDILSSVLFEAQTKLMLEESVVFTEIMQNSTDLVIENELDKVFLSVIIITRIINKY